LGARFLDPVLSEMPQAGIVSIPDAFRRNRFRDADQGHFVRTTARALTCRSDSVLNARDVLSNPRFVARELLVRSGSHDRRIRSQHLLKADAQLLCRLDNLLPCSVTDGNAFGGTQLP